MNIKINVSTRKNEEIEREMVTPLCMLRCVQHGISMADHDLLTVERINDMFV